jgi:hypothetical protein
MAAGDGASERAALADEVVLADELVEGPGTHPSRQRLVAGRRLDEWLLGPRGRPAGWHGVSMVAPASRFGRPPGRDDRRPAGLANTTGGRSRRGIRSPPYSCHECCAVFRQPASAWVGQLRTTLPTLAAPSIPSGNSAPTTARHSPRGVATTAAQPAHGRRTPRPVPARPGPTADDGGRQAAAAGGLCRAGSRA